MFNSINPKVKHLSPIIMEVTHDPFWFRKATFDGSNFIFYVLSTLKHNHNAIYSTFVDGQMQPQIRRFPFRNHHGEGDFHRSTSKQPRITTAPTIKKMMAVRSSTSKC